MDSYFWQTTKITKEKINTIQINLGNRCNLYCKHCHIEASPSGEKMMTKETARLVLKKLLTMSNINVEFTGGAPECNENLEMLIEELSCNGITPIVRTNLVILNEKPFSHFIDCYLKNKVKLIASLPSPHREITDMQRGRGFFDSFINVLKRLNDLGYGYDESLRIDLVTNPVSDYLPSDQNESEKLFKEILKLKYNVNFNRLISITNLPIGRCKIDLIRQNLYDSYMQILIKNFNPDTLNNLMCRSLVSVDYLGNIYDCDFNLALDMKIIVNEDKKFWDIDFTNFFSIVNCDKHCYACVAFLGSSCNGSLVKDTKEVKNVQETVKHYYGDVLKSTKDLKTNVCCSPESHEPHVREVLKLIADEVMQKYYGCGSPIPLHLKGLKILDIGSGTGRDCFVLSKLVGENGFVWGIDMTESQVRVAQKYVDYHKEAFGYLKPNVFFIHDYIENLSEYFEPDSLDLVVSNCVVNLLEDKEALLRQVYRILKEGGEMYFSDIYSDRRLPDEIRKDPILYGECLGGALYYKDFERLARRVGFTDTRVMSKRVVDITNYDIEQKVGNAVFYSITYRLFKIRGLEDACEDYGHVAIYRGGIEGAECKFILDEGHVFEKDKPELVCGNTALMLTKTRFKDYFNVIGDFSRHFGLFKGCGTFVTTNGEQIKKGSCC